MTSTAVSDAMSLESWWTIRLALMHALAAGHVAQHEYDRAMTEIVGTSDRNLW
jgi:hypothetical protein